MGKKAGIALVIAGAALILSALSLFLHNRDEEVRAGQEAEILLGNVQAVIQERRSPTRPPAPMPTEQPAETAPPETAPTEPLPPQLPVEVIDGYGYVGYLSIPEIGLELPVMSEWDYTRLRIAPCRQFGSSRTDDLVIAAHNYATHFGGLSKLTPGSTVTFTDMDGIENQYTVSSIQTLDPTAVAAVQYSGHALVLYTCTYGGQSRVTVFCDRPEPTPTGENT